MTPPLDLAAIRARAAAATPWTADECDLRVDEDGYVYAPQGACLGETLIQLGDTYENSGHDWAFIAHARTDVPALCDALDAARATIAAQAAEVERLHRVEAERDHLSLLAAQVLELARERDHYRERAQAHHARADNAARIARLAREDAERLRAEVAGLRAVETRGDGR